MKKLLLILLLLIGSSIYADETPTLVTGDIFSYKCVEVKFDSLGDLEQKIERILSAPDSMVIIVPEVTKRYFPRFGDVLPHVKHNGTQDSIVAYDNIDTVFFNDGEIFLITITNYNVWKTIKYERVYLDLILDSSNSNKAILIYRRIKE